MLCMDVAQEQKLIAAARSVSNLRLSYPFMKTVPALLAVASLIFASVSCDKHSWEETQVLHEGMHKVHGEDHGDAHHGEAKKDDHGKADAHAEKPAHAPEKKEEAKH